jgi:4-hydroxy-tetrahydrodipicolinate reductase
MKIGLIGYGKMGQMIHEIAKNRGHEISEIIDPKSPRATKQKFTDEATADVFIDFSTPESVLQNIDSACRSKKNIVVGTTGWTDHEKEIQEKVKKAGIGFLWASNFSPAVQMFFRVAQRAAQISNKLPESDVAVWEAHHKHKLDSPSGTAITLGKVLLKELEGKKQMLFDRAEGKIDPTDLHVASIRVGEVPGTHAAIFDFPDETVEVRCTSRNRNGFALGAVLAAEWLNGKSGFYCFDDIFEEIVAKAKRQTRRGAEA